MIGSLGLGALWLVLTVSGSDDAWSGFRGPDGSCVSRIETMVESYAAENVAWKIGVGAGYSSPILSERAVFLTAFEGLNPATFCFDRKTGKELWKTPAPKPLEEAYRGMNTPVSSTPATDGKRVYSYYMHFGLVCHDAESGDVVWQHEVDMLRVPHGMSSSPILAGGKVLLQCDQDTGSYLLALDKDTGKPAWKIDRPGITHGYSTPIVHQPKEGPVEVILSGAYQLTGHSLETGERLWWVDGMCWMPMAMPSIADGVVYVSSAMSSPAEFGAPSFDGTFKEALAEKDQDGDEKISKSEWPHKGLAELWFIYDLNGDDLFDEEDWNFAQARKRALGGTFAVKLGGKGDVTGSHILWKYDDRRGQSGSPSPLVYEGAVYLIKDGGVLTTLDAKTGDVLKQGRVGQPSPYSASPIGACGKVLLASGAGQVVLLDAGKEWEELGAWELDGDIWATPAVGNGQTFVRTKNWLYAFQATSGGH
ncbi:MAG: PQQ-binding-like beta-propeller repeat protein [Planctomycetota bacterium]